VPVASLLLTEFRTPTDAKDQCKAEVLNYEEVDVGEALKEMTGGRGPDACIDAVGMEAHGTGPDAFMTR